MTLSPEDTTDIIRLASKNKWSDEYIADLLELPVDDVLKVIAEYDGWKCKACRDTGNNTRGGSCAPCDRRRYAGANK